MPSNKKQRTTIGQGAANFLPPEPEETPTEQEASIPVSQDTGAKADFKATYYITPDHDMKLEQIRMARRRKGIRVDKSALIREAINLLQE